MSSPRLNTASRTSSRAQSASPALAARRAGVIIAGREGDFARHLLLVNLAGASRSGPFSAPHSGGASLGPSGTAAPIASANVAMHLPSAGTFSKLQPTPADRYSGGIWSAGEVSRPTPHGTSHPAQSPALMSSQAKEPIAIPSRLDVPGVGGSSRRPASRFAGCRCSADTAAEAHGRSGWKPRAASSPAGSQPVAVGAALCLSAGHVAVGCAARASQPLRPVAGSTAPLSGVGTDPCVHGRVPAVMQA